MHLFGQEKDRAAGFPFIQPGELRDGELHLRLRACLPGDKRRDWSPAYHFHLCREGIDGNIGHINLRIGDQPSIVLYAGHIGYGVNPDHRGNHFAERACRLIFPLARHHGINRLWITCNPDNMASYRTCERLGGEMVEIVDLPRSNPMYLRGERQKCRFRYDLEEA